MRQDLRLKAAIIVTFFPMEHCRSGLGHRAIILQRVHAVLFAGQSPLLPRELLPQGALEDVELLEEVANVELLLDVLVRLLDEAVLLALSAAAKEPAELQP